eukprot:TRINITY_DN8302_c0_g1_i2.p1 TRINITY_DN8302_c0_g1~~TRINITY_DN8302_c0_g1_i2.p1  ORF type:complete len:877 (-),score=114.96 TRINITY_DN8302_c0_g1_i2:51-2681(-)
MSASNDDVTRVKVVHHWKHVSIPEHLTVKTWHAMLWIDMYFTIATKLFAYKSALSSSYDVGSRLPFLHPDLVDNAIKQISSVHGDQDYIRQISEYLKRACCPAQNSHHHHQQQQADSNPRSIFWRSPYTPHGLVFGGPPGSGKSMLMKIIGQYSGMHVIFNKPASDLNKGLWGQSEEIIAHMFGVATRTPQALCVVCIDEVDSMASSDGPNSSGGTNGGGGNKRDILLSLNTKLADSPNLILLAATNKASDLDEAFVREGRCNKVFIGPRTQAARLDWLHRNVIFDGHDNNDNAGAGAGDVGPDVQRIFMAKTINFTIAQFVELETIFSVHCTRNDSGAWHMSPGDLFSHINSVISRSSTDLLRNFNSLCTTTAPGLYIHDDIIKQMTKLFSEKHLQTLHKKGTPTGRIFVFTHKPYYGIAIELEMYINTLEGHDVYVERFVLHAPPSYVYPWVNALAEALKVNMVIAPDFLGMKGDEIARVKNAQNSLDMAYQQKRALVVIDVRAMYCPRPDVTYSSSIERSTSQSDSSSVSRTNSTGHSQTQGTHEEANKFSSETHGTSSSHSDTEGGGGGLLSCIFGGGGDSSSDTHGQHDDYTTGQGSSRGTSSSTTTSQEHATTTGTERSYSKGISIGQTRGINYTSTWPQLVNAVLLSRVVSLDNYFPHKPITIFISNDIDMSQQLRATISYGSLPVLPDMLRTVYHDANHKPLNIAQREFLHLCQNSEDLSLQNCPINEKDMLYILDHMTKLKALSVTGCLFDSKIVPKIRRLCPDILKQPQITPAASSLPHPPTSHTEDKQIAQPRTTLFKETLEKIQNHARKSEQEKSTPPASNTTTQPPTKQEDTPAAQPEAATTEATAAPPQPAEATAEAKPTNV